MSVAAVVLQAAGGCTANVVTSLLLLLTPSFAAAACLVQEDPHPGAGRERGGVERHGRLMQPPNEDGHDCRYHPNLPRRPLPPNEDGPQISSRQQHSLGALMPQKLGLARCARCWFTSSGAVVTPTCTSCRQSHQEINPTRCDLNTKPWQPSVTHCMLPQPALPRPFMPVSAHSTHVLGKSQNVGASNTHPKNCLFHLPIS